MVLTLRNHFTILPFTFCIWINPVLARQICTRLNVCLLFWDPSVHGNFQRRVRNRYYSRTKKSAQPHATIPSFWKHALPKTCILVRNACPLWHLAHDPCNVASNCRQLPVLAPLVLNRSSKRSRRIAGSCKRRLTAVGFHSRYSVKKNDRWYITAANYTNGIFLVTVALKSRCNTAVFVIIKIVNETYLYFYLMKIKKYVLQVIYMF